MTLKEYYEGQIAQLKQIIEQQENFINKHITKPAIIPIHHTSINP